MRFSSCISIGICLTLFSCMKTDVNDQIANTVVLEGVLVQNAATQVVKLTHVSAFDETQTPTPIMDAEVWLRWGGERFDLAENDDGYYVIHGDSIDLYHGHRYDVYAVVEEDTVRAEATMPPSISYTPSNAGDLLVDTLTSGQVVLTVKWNLVENHQMVLELEELDPVDPIPFQNGGGFFDFSFNGPVIDTLVNVFDNDFQFQGAQRINLFRVNNAYSELYFYDPEPLSSNVFGVPDNIEGGLGYFTAVSAASVSMNLIVE